MSATSRPRGLRVGVIGAGIAGLTAARVLGDRRHDVTLFDKGHGPGGRCSSRRAAPFAFDHGAQYFTARDPRFRQELGTWRETGVAARWDGRIVALRDGEARPGDGTTERFVGTPAMSSLARHLARGLDVRQGVRVARIERREGRWRLLDEAGESLGEHERLVITAPPAQAAALIEDASPLGARAAGIELQPCWAVLLGLGGRLPVDFDGAFCEDSAFSWIARNTSKPGRPPGEAWVLHATPEWTAAHLDEAPDDVVQRLCTALQRTTGAPLPAVVHRAAHLWRYALPDPGLAVGSLVDRELGLALAGDAYSGGRIEGAYRSGLDAAERLGAV